MVNPNPSSLEEKRAAVKETCDKFIEAFKNLEWDTFRNSFDAEATVFFPFRESPVRWFRQRVSGREAIEAMFKPLFNNDQSPCIRPKELHIQMLDDVAVVTFHLIEHDEFGRRTIVLREQEQQKGQWLIVHLHASYTPPE